MFSIIFFTLAYVLPLIASAIYLRQDWKESIARDNKYIEDRAAGRISFSRDMLTYNDMAFYIILPFIPIFNALVLLIALTERGKKTVLQNPDLR